MKTIKRKWYSKKKKEWIEKVYHYTENKNYRLTTKKGKLSKKASDKYLKELYNGDIEKEMYVKATIREYMDKKKVLTTRMVNAMFSKNQLDIFMSNLNITYEQIVDDLKRLGIEVDITYVMNADNWSFTKGTMDAKLLLTTGQTVSFTFDYYDGYTINA